MIKTIIFALFLIDGEPHFLDSYPPMDMGSLQVCEQLLDSTASLQMVGYPYKAGCFVGTDEEFSDAMKVIGENLKKENNEEGKI